MKSFKNKQTGVILTPKNEWVEKQLEADSSYEVVGAKASNKASNKPTGEKAIKDMNKKELVAFLTEKGIEANEDMKKEDLLALIPQE